MDDQFLKDQRREPDAAFARGLRARLRTLEQDEAPRRRLRPAPLAAAAAALAVVGALFVSPGLRVQAQAMLDLFRVREFAVVQVDAARMQALRDRKIDPGTLLVGLKQRPAIDAPAQRFTSVAEASAAAGFVPERPTAVPQGMTCDTVWVHPGVRTGGTVDTRPLRELMDAFDVRDLQVPPGVDGRELVIDVPTAVVQLYRNTGSRRAVLVQCASPEVSLPPGVDLSRLGEIGLRLAGIERAEAHRLAGAIDWRSTLVVPVIASASTFQQVDVGGARGLYVETTHPVTPEDTHTGRGAAVMWTRNGRVYSLAGNLDRVSLMQMAESVR